MKLTVVLICYSCHSDSPNVHSSKSNKHPVVNSNWKMSPFGLLFDTNFIFLDPNMNYISFNSLYKLQSKRPVTMSVSLGTQTGLHCLTIQVLNTRVCFMDIWCTSLTSVHYNLEHGLAIVTESFSPLDLDYKTSFVKVKTRSDVTNHAIPW